MRGGVCCQEEGEGFDVFGTGGFAPEGAAGEFVAFSLAVGLGCWGWAFVFVAIA